MRLQIGILRVATLNAVPHCHLSANLFRIEEKLKKKKHGVHISTMRLPIWILRLATYTFGQHNYRSFDPSVEEAKQKIKTETKTKNIREKKHL